MIFTSNYPLLTNNFVFIQEYLTIIIDLIWTVKGFKNFSLFILTKSTITSFSLDFLIGATFLT